MQIKFETLIEGSLCRTWPGALQFVLKPRRSRLEIRSPMFF